ncbi:MAG: DUF1848 domain-containing protein [Tissierella sp.]|nr:DUF1848 domain-containing protein [Tissierella sp.]
MILSVSRRTDIPAFYSEWFINRIKDGYVYVRNPFNYNQVSKVLISPDNVDCIVFWTKNPSLIMEKLNILDNMNFKYYFQFTITPYGNDIEKSVIDKGELINAFIDLSSRIGKKRVILRYDPVLLTEKYNIKFHIGAFEDICQKLSEHTERIVFSFLDNYSKSERNLKEVKLLDITDSDMITISKEFKRISDKYGLSIETCAEKIELDKYGIRHGKCIDGELIEEIIGYKIVNKNKLDGNREACGCMKCIDIGQYDSCIHNCLYCYANVNKDAGLRNFKSHDPNSPILFGSYDDAKVSVRKDIKSLRDKVDVEKGEQLSLF